MANYIFVLEYIIIGTNLRENVTIFSTASNYHAYHEGTIGDFSTELQLCVIPIIIFISRVALTMATRVATSTESTSLP